MRFGTSGPIFLYIHVQDGETALCMASSNGHERIIEELLNREADVNHQDKVRSLMLWVLSNTICVVCHFLR